jgi:glutaminyl-tRNA synthetase
MKLRDPLLYRIRKVSHYRTGDQWCIYPFYDYAHPLSDALEGITHSLCTLEFENNRDIYDWVRDNTSVSARPEQTEFARLNLSYTLLSKRKLLQLVEGQHVNGWDDPRMPTLSGMRRRGITASAIRELCDRIGVAKSNSTVDVAQLESAIRDDLNPEVQRVLCVLRPLKVVITNYPEGEVEELEAPYYPHDVPKEGSRKLPFSREIFIDGDDFAEDPPKGFHRLAPGREVRLRYAYFIRCEEVVKDPASGEIQELRCTYDPATRGGSSPDGRKVKGTIHWVSAGQSRRVEVRLYDRLFSVERPDLTAPGEDFRDFLNPDSLDILEGAHIEAAAAETPPGTRFQFERQGYFYLEPEATGERGLPVYNRIVTLRDSWALRAPAGKPVRPAAEEPPPAPESSGMEAPPAPTAERAWTADELAALERFETLGLPRGDAEVLLDNRDGASIFEEALAASTGASPREVAKWVVNEVLRELKDRPVDDLPARGREIAELAVLVEDGTLSTTLAKEVFAEMLASGEPPGTIVERRGLYRIDDATELRPLVQEVLSRNPREAELYRGGKATLLGFFVGQVMKATGGKADARRVRELLETELRA